MSEVVSDLGLDRVQLGEGLGKNKLEYLILVTFGPHIYITLIPHHNHGITLFLILNPVATKPMISL